MSRAGSSSRKLPARTSSTSWHSAGEALCTDTARGRLLPAAIATIFVPLPRRVGPTARPPFSHSQRWHPRTPRPDSTGRAHASGAPVAVVLLPVSRSAPRAGIGGGRSGRVDIFRAVPATAPRFPICTTQHGAQDECLAMDDPACRLGAVVAAPVPRLPCSSVSSQRPRIGAFGDQQSVSRVPPIRLSHIYETGSRLHLCPDC